MPTYEYKCPKDGFRKEVWRSISDKEDLPDCELSDLNDPEHTMQRVFSPPAIQIH